MPGKTLLHLSLIVIMTATLTIAQRLPTTPPTFPQQKGGDNLVDINAATKEELADLPGVDNSSAQKIIDNQPYKKKNELKKRKIISEETYKQISDRITANPPKNTSFQHTPSCHDRISQKVAVPGIIVMQGIAHNPNDWALDWFYKR